MKKTESCNAFYFTYGLSDAQPYKGGWTEVYARSRKEAVVIFNLFHPPVIEGIVNCADIYDEERFYETEFPNKGNFGQYTREVIALARSIYG